MLANPYLPPQAVKELNDQIEKNGFIPDAFLTSDKDQAVMGLNLAMGWPFPDEIKIPYEELVHDLQQLKPSLYIYPYKQTHITIMTLVNFKDHKDPLYSEIENIHSLKSGIINIVSNTIKKDQSLRIRPFTIEIGFPVLSSAAVFLPILNPTGEVENFRDTVIPILKKQLNLNPLRPQAIHSTIARFLEKPENAEDFKRQFEIIALKHCLGKTDISEILFTSETKPYMRSGEILHTFYLSE